MGAAAVIPVSDGCPNRSVLLAFVTGQTAPPISVAIEAHVSLCPRCLEAIERIEEESDLVVRALAALPASADDEREFQQLQSQLLAASASSTTSSPANTCNSGDRAQAGPLPSQLGAYALIGEIGRGASGTVYRARHVKLDRVFAVKVLHRERTSDAHSSAHFLREMKAVGQLNHPHIVRATDAGEDQGYAYLVMEYAEGIDVSEMVRRLSSLSPADACEIARQAALGLEHAHGRGLIHRDLKPSNLLLTTAGQVKLLDLGLVAVSPDRGRLPDVPLDPFPRGTADYMAPEQWSDFQHVDHRADLYSLGCTLFKMATGRAPYQTLPDNCVSKMTAHQHAEIPRLRDGTPAELDHVVARLLAKRPKDRYQSVAALLVDLTPLAAGADLRGLLHRLGLPHEEFPVPLANPAVIGAPRTKDRISRRTMLVGGAAAVAMTAVYGRHFWRSVPSVQTGEWRTLAPAWPALLLSLDNDAQWTYEPNHDAISITSDRYALLNLGRPLRGVFSFRAALKLGSKGCHAGFFFRYREGIQDGALVRSFHLLDLFSKPGSVASGSILRWSHIESRQTPAENHVERKLWASTAVDGVAESGRLEITLGLDGFPAIMWKGILLPESQWKLSSEGRRKSRISRNRLPRDYLGPMGLLVSDGTAAFYRPQLMYRDLS